MKKKVAAIGFAVVALSLGYLNLSPAQAKAAGSKKTYQATVYVAGHGGHFAAADVVIDPNDAANPLKVTSLDRVEIGTPESHKMHDGRLDGTTLFFSTYALDKEGKLHVGKADVTTGKVLQDVAISPDPRSPMKSGPAYCASGQSKTAFMPVFMGNEGYVDVWDKKTLEHKHRVFISDLGFKPGSYIFMHGTSSNDGKRFLVALTMKGEDGKMNGKQELMLLDLPALEKGKLKKIASRTLTGEPGKTITFRQYFTSNDKLIYQAAADRMWLLDAKTLKQVDEKMTKPAGENHDVQPTPDGKFALLTLRTADTAACDPQGTPISGQNVTDGALMLYDATAKKLVGSPVSVCFGCHKDAGLGDKNAVLCGLATTYK